MKRLLLLFSLWFFFQPWASTQEIGLRFGDIVDNDFAIDGVIDLYRGRIHADLSFGRGHVGLEVLYDFLYTDLCAPRIYFYAGAGGFMSFGDPFRVGASGEAGIDYRFQKLPLVVGFDWRPALRFVDDLAFYTDRFGINVRWSFRRRSAPSSSDYTLPSY